MDKVAVLASGGLDSSVLVAEMARAAEVHPIYVKCGLAWEQVELKGLQAFLNALDNPNVMPLTVLAAPVTDLYGDHWSVSGKDVPDADAPDEKVFLPGRNILLIGLAAIWCGTHDVSRIAIGSLAGNPFPDATSEFFASFAHALSLGLRHEIKVDAPWLGLHKDDVVRLYKDLPLELTFTCMAPQRGKHCGRCNKCRERQVAFEKSGITDRTDYAA
ncbi:MAG TPA: 7-cyano-7-deazaguanine synthase [Candidatus Binataceae bacterium]|nr:7-cyano-7-deazaguanine synthase [Candidatus Binataceae bacterium]